jgi:hypothetical protein
MAGDAVFSRGANGSTEDLPGADEHASAGGSMAPTPLDIRSVYLSVGRF